MEREIARGREKDIDKEKARERTREGDNYKSER
jgi:hypothetical protein